MKKILHIKSSIRGEDSVTASISQRLIDDLVSADSDSVVTRDVSSDIPLIDGKWAAANFTAESERSAEDNKTLALSDTLIKEVEAAETIVIGLPIYNFMVPAGFKAWIDQLARVGKTFQYGKNGPEGLLKNKKVYLVFASGGTPIGSEYEFASHYTKHVLNFMGITDITVLAADSADKTVEDVLAAA